MKALKLIAWVSLGIGAVILLLGIISGMFLARPYLGMVTNATTFFMAANSFFLMSVALFIYNYRCRCNED
jgi:uncharacterized membrane protein